MKPIITPITEKYIESYSKAVDSVARERKYLSFLQGPSLEMSRMFVAENLKQKFPHFIALDKDKVIGWGDITPADIRPIFIHSGELGIGVLSNYRGQGIGELLIKAAINEAKKVGFTRIQLTVRENNKAAIMLYKKVGFVLEGLQRNAIKIDNIYENRILMALVW